MPLGVLVGILLGLEHDVLAVRAASGRHVHVLRIFGVAATEIHAPADPLELQLLCGQPAGA